MNDWFFIIIIIRMTSSSLSTRGRGFDIDLILFFFLKRVHVVTNRSKNVCQRSLFVSKSGVWKVWKIRTFSSCTFSFSFPVFLFPPLPPPPFFCRLQTPVINFKYNVFRRFKFHFRFHFPNVFFLPFSYSLLPFVVCFPISFRTFFCKFSYKFSIPNLFRFVFSSRRAHGWEIHSKGFLFQAKENMCIVIIIMIILRE